MDTFSLCDDQIEILRSVFGDEAVNQALNEIADEETVRRRMRMLENAKMAQACRVATDRPIGESGLRPDMEIDEVDYHHWGMYFKVRDVQAGILDTTGYECWNDPQFLAEYKRDNPHSVIVLAKNTNTVLVDGFRQEPLIVAATKHTPLPAQPLPAAA